MFVFIELCIEITKDKLSTLCMLQYARISVIDLFKQFST